MVFAFVITALLLFFHRQILAIFSIIAGDKNALHEAGNLCDSKDPWANSSWTAKEMRKPGDPEPPPPLPYEWWMRENEKQPPK